MLNELLTRLSVSSGDIIIPSDLKLDLKQYQEFRDLALKQFPTIPADILDTFHPENQTFHL